MIDHAPDCEVLLPGGVCTCKGPRVVEPHPHLTQKFGPLPTEPYQPPGHGPVMHPRAGTSRSVDTDPRITWLGKDKHVHPPFCAVYQAPEANWAPYCTCYIAVLAAETGRKPRPEIDGYVTEPPDDIPPAVDGPKEYRPTRLEAPRWAWVLIGFGAGAITTATTWALWPL